MAYFPRDNDDLPAWAIAENSDVDSDGTDDIDENDDVTTRAAIPISTGTFSTILTKHRPFCKCQRFECRHIAACRRVMALIVADLASTSTTIANDDNDDNDDNNNDDNNNKRAMNAVKQIDFLRRCNTPRIRWVSMDRFHLHRSVHLTHHLYALFSVFVVLREHYARHLSNDNSHALQELWTKIVTDPIFPWAIQGRSGTSPQYGNIQSRFDLLRECFTWRSIQPGVASMQTTLLTHVVDWASDDTACVGQGTWTLIGMVYASNRQVATLVDTIAVPSTNPEILYNALRVLREKDSWKYLYAQVVPVVKKELPRALQETFMNHTELPLELIQIVLNYVAVADKSQWIPPAPPVRATQYVDIVCENHGQPANCCVM